MVLIMSKMMMMMAAAMVAAMASTSSVVMMVWFISDHSDQIFVWCQFSFGLFQGITSGMTTFGSVPTCFTGDLT